MKKSLATGMLALLAGASVVHGQGSVSLGNYLSAISTYLYVGYKPTTGPTVELGGAATGPVATLNNYAAETGNGNDWTVQIYGAVGSGLPAASLSPVAGATASFANGGTDKIAGTWFSASSATFVGAPNGTTATIQLYAWYNEGGLITSYATALADNVPTGFSAPANVTLGAPPGTPAALPDALGNFNLTTTTPEPSTIALGVIGASAFLMRLRRKQ